MNAAISFVCEHAYDGNCPNGATSSSPGLRRRRYPGATCTPTHSTPTGLWPDPQGHNPFRVVLFDGFCIPRVAAARQPWAEGRNAVGVEDAFCLFSRISVCTAWPTTETAPTGLRPPAQGCAEGATLGPRSTPTHSTPTGLWLNPRHTVRRIRFDVYEVAPEAHPQTSSYGDVLPDSRCTLRPVRDLIG